MRRLFTLALVFLLCLASCQKAPLLSLTSPASVDLSVDGSSGTITFTANRDWTISTSDSWVSVSPSSGSASDEPVTVTVRCGANTTYDDREEFIQMWQDYYDKMSDDDKNMLPLKRIAFLGSNE